LPIGILRIRAYLAAYQTLAQVLSQLICVGVDVLISRKESATEMVDKGRAGETFLHKEAVVFKRRVDLPKSIGHARRSFNSVQLTLESFGCHSRMPELFECNGLFQICPDFLFEDLPRYCLLERLGRTNLVRIVDALDGLLGLHTLLKGEVPG
jgi:hypothetical protein